MLTLWIATASDLNERHSYLKDLAETAAICEKMTENDSNNIVAVTYINYFLIYLNDHH